MQLKHTLEILQYDVSMQIAEAGLLPVAQDTCEEDARMMTALTSEHNGNLP